jgi:hypothetical protein
VTREPVVWRRLTVTSPYVGDVGVSGAALRFFGREPITGIEVSLAIPFSEIKGVRASRSSTEELGGEPSLVLELAESDPVCLRSAGTSEGVPARLARLLRRVTAAQSHSAGLEPALGGDRR